MTGSRRWLLPAVALWIGLTGCQREEGPAEKMGRALDEAVHDTGDAFEEAGEDLRDELEKE